VPGCPREVRATQLTTSCEDIGVQVSESVSVEAGDLPHRGTAARPATARD